MEYILAILTTLLGKLLSTVLYPAGCVILDWGPPGPDCDILGHPLWGSSFPRCWIKQDALFVAVGRPGEVLAFLATLLGKLFLTVLDQSECSILG